MSNPSMFGHHKKHTNIKLSPFHYKWCNILIKLEGGVVGNYVNVISKFGYDQINISYRNLLLRNMSNPIKFGSHKKHIKIKLFRFDPKWCNNFQKISGIVVVTSVKVILKFGYDISY